LIRHSPFNVAHLKDEDMTVDFSRVTTPNDRVAIIATVPLTDNEPWQAMMPGTLWMFHGGNAVVQLATTPSPIKSLDGCW
ncbi:MAG: class II glutamine amidotransferase, partial [Candidatus Nitrotoga sp.]